MNENDVDGSIHSIHVRNFFCHENLEINLNKNVNFIVGRNGSGKSAILTAIVVGLGGRASATNRGSNISSFIKKGANSATVEIKIKNSSAKAYKRDIYGDYITIVRNITASGSSSYKVKNVTGEIISTKFEEVNAIILAHEIQVDNPISVLNQDDARSFHASDANKKYLLFRKATNLDKTESNYTEALDNCNKAVSIWNRKNDACAELKKEYNKWKTSHDHLQSQQEFEEQKQALQNEYYWSEITEYEQQIVTTQTQYDKQNAKCEKLIKSLQNMDRQLGGDNTTIQTLKNQLAEKTSQRTTLEEELQQLENEMRNLQVTWRGEQHSISKLKEQINREQRKVADLKGEIQNIKSGDAAPRRQQLETAVEKARGEAAAIRARYETAQHDATQARAHAAHAQQPADAATARASRQRDTIRQLKQQLRELESRGNDSLAVYGSDMVKLFHSVRQAADSGHFSAPPRGPVGHYLKLKEKKWGGAVEHIIGGSIRSFCVNTPEDSRKLFKIMEQVYGNKAKPGVTCSGFLRRQHDVSRNMVSSEAGTCALDAFEIKDPVVANFLIDNIGLESILLIENDEDAIRLAHTVENVPARCSKIVTLESTEYYPAPNYRIYGGAKRPARLLHMGTDERKKQIFAEIHEAETMLKTYETKAEELNVEAKRAREHERAASKALEALFAAQHQKEQALTRAVAELDQRHEPQHDLLMAELNISENKLRTLKEQAETFAEKEEKFKELMDKNKIKIQEAKPMLVEAVATCRRLEEEIEKEKIRVDRGMSERCNCEQRLSEEKVKLEEIKVILKYTQALVTEKIEKALILCPRVEAPRDKAIVTSELKKTELKLNSIRSDGLDRAQVAERLLAVERKYRHTRHALDRLRVLIQDIKSTTDKHLKYCYKVQTYVSRRVQHCFQSILTLRGLAGHMEIEHAKGSLEIVCTGRDSAPRRAASTSSLSGGERSYSTVAFLMSLWECVELPFYFLDEFDVFMDNVNRKIVLKLLVDHALRNPSRQFVFLTPQDSSTVTASSNVSIHLMADPRP